MNTVTNTAAVDSNGVLEVSGHSQDYKVRVLGVDISKSSQTAQFLIVSAGVLFFFILYGYILEAIFLHPTIKSQGLYVTFFQFVLYSVFALLESLLETKGNMIRRVPISTYNVVSLLTVTTMTLSHISLGYLNYPTQVIFKSCKLIPVLIGGILIQGKKFVPNDFVAATLMCIGLIWFTLVDVSISPKFDPIGVAMISVALVADAIIGNLQEKVMKTYGASNSEVVLYSYSIGMIYLGLALIVTNQLIPAVQTGFEYPFVMYGYGVLLSITGYLGVNLVLTLVRVSGAFAAVTVTTFRKAVSIVISFLVFFKPFTMQYVWSGSLVIFGVYLNLLGKKSSSSTLFYCQWIKKLYLNSIGFYFCLFGLFNGKSTSNFDKSINQNGFQDDGQQKSLTEKQQVETSVMVQPKMGTCDEEFDFFRNEKENEAANNSKQVIFSQSELVTTVNMIKCLNSSDKSMSLTPHVQIDGLHPDSYCLDKGEK